jgi:acetyl-CoA synthetase
MSMHAAAVTATRSAAVPAGAGEHPFWTAARRELDGLPGGHGLNIAYEAVDRHVVHGRGDVVALRCLAVDGAIEDVTYTELRRRTNRFARVLEALAVPPGAVVALLLGRVPALHVAALGAFKHRNVVCPLFSAFGPEPVRQRLTMGGARVLVTTSRLYERKIAAIRDQLPDLTDVLVVDGPAPDGTRSLAELMATVGEDWVIPPTDPADVALLHFTSGTTGTPKGALHVHEAVVAHAATGHAVLGLRPGDVFWCTADPGWVTGTSYGIISPLTNGVTSLVEEREFDADGWYRVLAEQHVTVFYTAPTALRMLMRAGAERAHGYDLSSLRHLASVGEPLDAATVAWTEAAFGQPAHDTWWQTETGGIMIGNRAGEPVRPGSMGRPLPGVEAAVAVTGEDGRAAVGPDGAPVPVEHAGTTGELVLRAGWPSMFRGYLGLPERYAACFAGGWYLTGDLASRDEDGYFWFVGRADDVIKSSGHLIGPFEVERVLLSHPAVAEAGVYGFPDPLIGEVVHARVSLKTGFVGDEALRRELMAHARRALGPAVAPRALEFDQCLPKTKSGKIMRRVLRARELGLPVGDLSTAENGDQQRSGETS